ncbi:MAG: Rossmann-like domain-containing protein, partial [Promethearchaeota archaeon]
VTIVPLFSSDSYPQLSDVVIGSTFCAVRTGADIVGLAFSATNSQNFPIHGENSSLEWSWERLLGFYLSESQKKRSLGLAAINALSQTIMRQNSVYKLVEESLGLLSEPEGLQFGMVGAIHPIITQIIEQKGQVLLRDDMVLQRDQKKLPKNGVTLIPFIEELKNVDHLLVSGSAIVHKGFNDILEIVNTIKGQRILVGPSAQILPQAAFKDGFTVVASSWVEQVEPLLQKVRGGGGYPHFQKYCRKYVVRKK